MSAFNNAEFDKSIKQLNDLYEEGKLCLLSLSILEEERSDYDRVIEVLREMRDLSAVQMQRVHMVQEN